MARPLDSSGAAAPVRRIVATTGWRCGRGAGAALDLTVGDPPPRRSSEGFDPQILTGATVTLLASLASLASLAT